MSDDIQQMLGRMDGKLDQLIDSFKEHKDDDTRRFTQVYDRLEQHASDINKAKGAKGAILWAASGVAALAGVAGTYIAKVMGLHQ